MSEWAIVATAAFLIAAAIAIWLWVDRRRGVAPAVAELAENHRANAHAESERDLQEAREAAARGIAEADAAAERDVSREADSGLASHLRDLGNGG